MPTDTGDRFCPACGTALAGSGLVEDQPAGWAAVSDSPDEPELLGLEAVPAGPGPGRPPSGERRWPRLWLAVPAGVLVLAVALWAVGRSGADPDDAGDTAPPGASTTQPGAADADDTAAGSDEPATTETTADPATIPTYDAEAGGPVLGRPIGWSLLIGDSFQTPLGRLDLDTGERVDFEGVTAAPVAALDGHLVLQEEGESGTTLRIVPVDDPAAEGIEILASQSSFGPQWPVVPAGDGGLWIYDDTDGTTTWRLIRLRDGKLLDEVPAPSSFQVYPVSGGGPEVTTSTSGGVYRRDGTGYRLISPGRPVTVHQGAVLVTICSAPADCQLQWLDADTGEPVERPLPPAGAAPGVTWAGMIDDAGRFLIGYRLTGPTGSYALALFDRDRQRVTAVDLDDFSGGLAASPDGRYLAATGPRGITIYDADQDRWITVRQASYNGAGVLFVANGGDR